MSEVVPGVSKIEDGLYQGALSCVVKHWDEIKDLFDWIVLCATEVEKLPRGERHILYCPIDDNDQGISEDAFRLLWLNVASGNGRLLTICHMGENRSGLASAMALIMRGHNVEDAITTVRREGNKISPGVPHSFWNEGFARQLREKFGPTKLP